MSTKEGLYPYTVSEWWEEEKPARTLVVLPPGKYVVGDPCYQVPDEAWQDWLEAANYTHPERRHVLCAAVNGHPCVGVSTAYGDGEYDDDDGYSYGVDAGLLGLVPVEVAKDLDSLKVEGMGRVVTFTEPVHCYYDDGDVHLGPVTVHTGDDDNPWS